MELSGKYAITDQGKPAGELKVYPWGAYLRFQAVCRSQRQGVFRLAAVDGDRTVPLGVMTPSGSGWSLDRRFSSLDLERLGLERIDACLLTDDPGTWRAEPSPQRLFRDESIRRVCLDMRGALYRQAGDTGYLAVPLGSRQPFPAMPIFCFGEVKKISGESFVIFAIRDGALTII